MLIELKSGKNSVTAARSQLVVAAIGPLIVLFGGRSGANDPKSP
jgi:hypothetical protein